MSSPINHLYRVPEEVFSTVFSYLENKTLHKLRHVSRRLKELVDEYGAYQVKFLSGDTSDKIFSKCCRRVNKITFYRYSPSSVPIVKFVNCVSTLKFAEDCNLDVIRDSLKLYNSISKLVFCLTIDSFKIFDQNFQCLPVLQGLRNLSILHLKGIEFNLQPNEVSLLQQLLLCNYKIVNLRVFVFACTVKHETVSDLFAFLHLHSDQLEHLTIECRGLYHTDTLTASQYALVPPQFPKLKVLRLRCVKFTCARRDLHKIWEKLIVPVHILDVFEYDLNYFKIDQLFLKLENSQSTVREICAPMLENTDCSQPETSDFSWLTNCPELRHLNLGFGNASRDDFRFGYGLSNPCFTKRINFIFPVTLTTLTLFGCSIERQWLVDTLTRLTNLKSVTLKRLGNRFDFVHGVNHVVFAQILKKCPNLNKLTLSAVSAGVFTIQLDQWLWDKILSIAGSLTIVDVQERMKHCAILLNNAVEIPFDVSDIQDRRILFQHDLDSLYKRYDHGVQKLWNSRRSGTNRDH